MRGLLLLVPTQTPTDVVMPTQTPTDVAMPEEAAVEVKADERHVPNPSWEPWQWARHEGELNGKIVGTAAVLVQPHCRKVYIQRRGGCFAGEGVCVCGTCV